MQEDSRARARDRVLLQLKTKGEQTAGQLADRLGITPMGVRQHLASLLDEKLVCYRDERRKVGRPARVWALTPTAAERFPDSHAELTVGLLDAMHEAFGDEGVDRLLAVRSRQQLKAYRAALPRPGAALDERVAALCKIRKAEGYMAEWSRDGDGFVLAENHCPICAAATACQGLCRDELDIFRKLLGRRARVERTDHILSGARRCAYRITPK